MKDHSTKNEAAQRKRFWSRFEVKAWQLQKNKSVLMQGDFIYMLTYFGTFGLQACVNRFRGGRRGGGGCGGLEVSDTSNQESSLALTKST